MLLTLATKWAPVDFGTKGQITAALAALPNPLLRLLESTLVVGPGPPVGRNRRWLRLVTTNSVASVPCQVKRDRIPGTWFTLLPNLLG